MLKLGKYLVITSSLYQLNIAGTTELSDTTQIQKLWKYLVITTSKDTRADNVGITQVMRLGKNLVISIQHIMC